MSRPALAMSRVHPGCKSRSPDQRKVAAAARPSTMVSGLGLRRVSCRVGAPRRPRHILLRPGGQALPELVLQQLRVLPAECDGVAGPAHRRAPRWHGLVQLHLGRRRQRDVLAVASRSQGLCVCVRGRVGGFIEKKPRIGGDKAWGHLSMSRGRTSLFFVGFLWRSDQTLRPCTWDHPSLRLCTTCRFCSSRA